MGQLMDDGYMVEVALKAGGETLRTDLQLLDSKSGGTFQGLESWLLEAALSYPLSYLKRLRLRFNLNSVKRGVSIDIRVQLVFFFGNEEK